MTEQTAAAEPGQMSLAEHLGELRRRLVRCTAAVLIFGVAALMFAKPIFGVLMRPVLDALPADGRSLIYTSGIEEINVLMKVGLYSGIFFSTPVILWQVWGFVSPGLYAEERKFAAPFVFFGTLAFITGAAFCYFVILPSMFQFLLREGDSAALESRLETARRQEAEVLRAVSLGEFELGAEIAAAANRNLGAEGEGQVVASERPSEPIIELSARLEGTGRIFDAAVLGLGPSARPALRETLKARRGAAQALSEGRFAEASRLMDESSALLAGAVTPPRVEEFKALHTLERELAAGKARYIAQTWTRPMLTMREQLSLVLILELAFGIIFELPIVMALLGVVGILKFGFLMKYQRHAFVVCLIVAAIVTPTGDAVNLLLMAGPMLLCFELGVMAVWAIEKRRARREKSLQTTPP